MFLYAYVLEKISYIPNVQVSDTTGDAQRISAGNKNAFIAFYPHSNCTLNIV